MPAWFSLNDLYYLLPELVLASGVLALLVATALTPKRRQGWLSWLALGALAASAAAVLAVARPVPVDVARGLISVDAFAAFFKGIVLLAAALTVLLSVRYLDTEGARHGSYMFLVLCATLGMMFMASGTDLVVIFVGLETMAIAFYILAGLLKPDRRSNEAAVKYFLLGAFSLGILLYGISILYGMSGTTNLRALAEAVAARGRDPWLMLALILVAAGIGFKIAAVPFHMWAPDVYEGAPTPITAFLSVGSKAASFAMLLRIFLEGLPSLSGDWTILFYVLAVVTMTVGNIAALTQSNTKRMLAYSSIAHAGYLLIGVIAGTTRGVTAMLIYFVIYAFMQMGAFAVVVLLRRADVIGDELKDLGGLLARQPFAAVAMLVFMLSLGGIPPTAGFMGKFWLFSAAIDANYVWLAVIGVLNSAVSLYYYLRVVVFMFMKHEAAGSQPALSPALTTALVVTLAGTLVLGVYPRPLFELAELSARALGVVGVSATVF
ncbi:MAG TPA: NADH-quinone oxidoreductase subunit N [Vicinamibacterales bacterium]|nr:NADH-quinone oxidoreductase subunit N [Vicinamibacterales bacterium]HPK71524.1 NADH-quinone oxidoreductase subunit N [Vicinamibacterales bacterium]